MSLRCLFLSTDGFCFHNVIMSVDNGNDATLFFLMIKIVRFQELTDITSTGMILESLLSGMVDE